MASLFKMWARGASQTVVSFLVKQLDESLTHVRWIYICYAGSSHNIYQPTRHSIITRCIQYPCQLLKLLRGQESASFDSLRIGTPEDMQKLFRLHSSVFGSVGEPGQLHGEEAGEWLYFGFNKKMFIATMCCINHI